MKFFKVLSLALFAFFCFQTVNIQAVLVSATTQSNGDKIEYLFGELHGLPHDANQIQAWELKEIINSYDPQDLCVITEAIESPKIVREKQEALVYDGLMSTITNEIAAICQNKKIETHRIDFRKIWAADTKTIISIRQNPDKVTLKKFAQIITQQVDIVDEVDKNIIPEDQRKIIKKLVDMCNSQAFVNKNANSLFDYCKTLSPQEDLYSFKIHELIWSLIDARIIAAAQATQKKIIIIVAGHAHINNARSFEQAYNQYKPVSEVKEPKEIALLTNLVTGRNANIVTASIPAVYIKKFWQDTQSIVESSKSNAKEFEEKKEKMILDTADNTIFPKLHSAKKLKF